MLMSGKFGPLEMRVRQVEVLWKLILKIIPGHLLRISSSSQYITPHNNRNTEFTTLQRLDNSQGENLSDVLHIRISAYRKFREKSQKLFSRINLDCHRGSRLYILSVLSGHCLIFVYHTSCSNPLLILFLD